MGADDSHVVAATAMGADRPIDLVNVATGAARRITTACDHPSSFIIDLGAR